MYYLLDNFFMVHPDQMIRPFPRYHELYNKRGLSIDTAERARKRFSKKDIIDLQCWSNLVWMHPLCFEQRRRVGRVPPQGSGLDGEGKAVAHGQADGTAAAGRAAASRAEGNAGRWS